MDELKFVLKCFIFASLVMVFSQTRSGGLTLESKAEVFLTESSTARFMQTAAEGGAKFLSEMYSTTKSYLTNKMGHASNRPEPLDDDTI
jgi:hypothetical protein